MFQFATGNYVGNGNSSGPVVSVGFAPCAVIIKRSDGSDAGALILEVGGVVVCKVSQNGGLLATPATIGTTTFALTTTDTALNQNGSHYSWVALAREAGSCDTFSYTGNGGNGRNVGAIAFTPDAAFYFANTSERSPMWTVTGAAGGRSMYWGDGAAGQAPVTNGIIAMTSSGVTVSAYCNPNAITCYMLCLKSGAPYAQASIYTGDGLAGHTVAHGVGGVPKMVMVEAIGATQDGVIRTDFDGVGDVGYKLSGSAATTGYMTALGSTNVTLGSSVVVNTNAATYAMLALGAVSPVSFTHGGLTLLGVG